jgi:hypothetical protein
MCSFCLSCGQVCSADNSLCTRCREKRDDRKRLQDWGPNEVLLQRQVQGGNGREGKPIDYRTEAGPR